MQALNAAANGAEMDKAVEEACARFNEKNQNETGNALTLRRAHSLDQGNVRKFLSTGGDGMADPRDDGSSPPNFHDKECRFWDVPNFFALILEQRTDRDIKNGIHPTSTSTCCGLVTFYLAYSTWDARVLYLDKLLLPKDGFGSSNSKWSMRLQFALADIAVNSGCKRYTWQHRSPCPTFPGKIQPETLHGWLTLHQQIQAQDLNNPHQPESDQAIINRCLERLHQQQQSSSSSCFRLRLSSVDDLQSIERLVHGLALFEKEPESVHVTKEHYMRDGFNDNQPPLFHCLLLENNNHDGPNNTAPPYVFGMAFCYFGYSLGEGRFFYLEDLFIEEAYRGRKGGGLAMAAVAEIARATGCVRCVWQALDWNTPALEFYGKLGARVQGGLHTTRFAGQGLEDFVLQQIG